MVAPNLLSGLKCAVSSVFKAENSRDIIKAIVSKISKIANVFQNRDNSHFQPDRPLHELGTESCVKGTVIEFSPPVTFLVST